MHVGRDYLWGAATSSYQIEGGARDGGRGPSIWDTFCARPGAIADGSNGDVACDHVHRWREDVALMRDLDLQAYRFSIAWPRIQPDATARINEAGLAFYEQLVDALLAAGIRPFVTLYHWDLPQWIEDRGGWRSRDTAERFADYTSIVAKRLGDRVRDWMTINEPWCIGMLGHATGEHAPGLRDSHAALIASHHVLLAHGLGVRVLRETSPAAQVGIALNATPAQPATESDADRDATRLFDGWFNRWYFDPVFGRGYPADMVAHYAQRGWLPGGLGEFVRPGDLDLIASPTDFTGLNYYTRALCRARVESDPPHAVAGTVPGPGAVTEMGWEINADGLHRLLTRTHRDYGARRIYITENGCSYSDGPNAAGEIHDERRIAYLHDHLAACRQAIAEGVPLAGYFQWSLLDNFEWQFGYQQRFGMVWVDYATQQRIPKASARWYRDMIRGL